MSTEIDLKFQVHDELPGSLWQMYLQGLRLPEVQLQAEAGKFHGNQNRHRVWRHKMQRRRWGTRGNYNEYRSVLWQGGPLLSNFKRDCFLDGCHLLLITLWLGKYELCVRLGALEFENEFRAVFAECTRYMELRCEWYAPPQNLSRSSSADYPKIHRGLIKTLIKPTALYKPTRSAVPRFISNNTPQSCQPLNDFITRWTRKSVHRILITLFSLHIWKLFMCHQMAQQHEKKEKEKAKLASSGQTAVSFDVVPTITTAAWFDKKQTNTVN